MYLRHKMQAMKAKPAKSENAKFQQLKLLPINIFAMSSK